MKKPIVSPTFIVVDLFCGFGGTTTGFEDAQMKPNELFKTWLDFRNISGFDDEFAKANYNRAFNVAKVIACVNHDPMAIKSHWLNHPDVKHFQEDIRTLDLAELVKTVEFWKKVYPTAKLILWASLECTNFSKAKGGLSRDADSRTLADHLDRYILAINPDYIQIENVVEFMSWGPLKIKAAKHHKDRTELKITFNKKKQRDEYHWEPASKKKGRDFEAWKNRIDSYGYRNEWRELNSANFGAYTSRNRLFGIFAKLGLPIAWPAATHSKKPSKVASLFEANMERWKPVKHVLDFTDEGTSIFARKKPLSEKTLERIYAGLVKYVAGGKDAFMLKYNSVNTSGHHRPPSIEEPCPTIATQGRLGVVKAAFISKYFSGRPDGKNISVEGPAGTIKTVDSQALIQANFLAQRNGGNPDSRIVDIGSPARTLTATGGNQDLITAKFLTKYHGQGFNSDVESPSPTIATVDQIGIVQAQYFIYREFKSVTNSSIDEPVGALTTVPKLNLIKAENSIDGYLISSNFNNGPTDLDSPNPTITANRKWHYLVNPQWFGSPLSVDEPCPTIIARQDKAPLYLIDAVTGDIAIQIFEDDSEFTIKIKEFMAIYGIVDVKMRMLRILEMLQIQGFPATYKMEGTQSDQKKFIGNSVVPILPKVWVIALSRTLHETYLKIAA